MTAFGTRFIILNDIQQQLNPKFFSGGPWLHLASIGRGFKEYMLFRHVPSGKIYLEEIDVKIPTLFKKIEDTQEWKELSEFCEASGLLSFNTDNEFKVISRKE